MNMNLFAHVVMLGWIPVVLFLFATLPTRRAVIVAFLTAWLFLPMAGYQVKGLPDYTKMSATCAGVLLATLIFDISRLRTFRPHWADLPMLVWCSVPFLSSLSNDLGPYDGFSATLERTVEWGFPYFIGRVYFRDLAALRELAIGIFIGGLVYVPLCLFEIKMSPQLHLIFYGFHQHDWVQTLRFGGWRPMVFMQHGLMVGMWMTAAALLGIWLWRTRTVRWFGALPVWPLLGLLLLTTALCKSLGSALLLVIGVALLFFAERGRRGWAVLLVALVPAGYMLARTAGHWDGAALVRLAERINPERAESLEFRLVNEDKLMARALQRPGLGWGGWGRNLVRDESTEANMTTPDEFWVIAAGLNGLVGLGAITLAFMLPPLLFLRRVSTAHWGKPVFAPAAALCVLLLMYALDNLPNAMINPIFILCNGAVVATATARVAARTTRVARLVGPRQSQPTTAPPGVDPALGGQP
jgi:hypothetical protein